MVALEAVALGIHLRVLYRLRDENRLVSVSRGLYRLVDLPDLSEPYLVSVAARKQEKKRKTGEGKRVWSGAPDLVKRSLF